MNRDGCSRQKKRSTRAAALARKIAVAKIRSRRGSRFGTATNTNARWSDGKDAYNLCRTHGTAVYNTTFTGCVRPVCLFAISGGHSTRSINKTSNYTINCTDFPPTVVLFGKRPPLPLLIPFTEAMETV